MAALELGVGGLDAGADFAGLFEFSRFLPLFSLHNNPILLGCGQRRGVALSLGGRRVALRPPELIPHDWPLGCPLTGLTGSSVEEVMNPGFFLVLLLSQGRMSLWAAVDLSGLVELKVMQM